MGKLLYNNFSLSTKKYPTPRISKKWSNRK
nr:MAG TPA: hypothetical protein [Caudoviricetes sp.]